MCLPRASLLGTFGLYSLLAASTHTQMRCVWENNELFFCHNSRPKKQRGVMCYESCSSFATNTSVVMKAGSLLSVEMQRKSEGKACVCVCVSVCVGGSGSVSSWAHLLLCKSTPPAFQMPSSAVPPLLPLDPTHTLFSSFSVSANPILLSAPSRPLGPASPSLSRQESLKLTETKRWREKGEIELGTSAHT